MQLENIFKRLIIPYLFFYLLGMIVFLQNKGLYKNLNVIVVSTGKLLWGTILTDPSNTFIANGPIWFLLALFIVICLFSFLKSVFKEDKYILISILFFNLLLYLLHMWKIDLLYFSLDSSLLGIMFFYTGYISKKHGLIKYFNNNNVNLVLSLILLATVYTEYVFNGALALRRGSWGDNFILCYLGAFAGILMIIAISSLLAKYKNKMIFLISINTLTIMGLDQILRHFIALMSNELNLKINYPLFNMVMNTLIIILLAVAIAMILDKYAPVLIGNKKNIDFNHHLNRVKNLTKKKLDRL